LIFISQRNKISKATSEKHTHVMSNENKFPLKENALRYTTPFNKWGTGFWSLQTDVLWTGVNLPAASRSDYRRCVSPRSLSRVEAYKSLTSAFRRQKLHSSFANKVSHFKFFVGRCCVLSFQIEIPYDPPPSAIRGHLVEVCRPPQTSPIWC
jgi:hypothetical protein